jgi:hypothetical protein
MGESFLSIYIFLLPVVGFVWFHRKHAVERHIERLSGIELTYSSSLTGGIFFLVSFVIVRAVNWTTVYYGNEKFLRLRSNMLGLCPHRGVIYFSFALLLAFLCSRIRFKNKNESVYLGGSKLGEIWYGLSEKKANIIIFLKNNKSYIGILRQVEVNERVPFSERVVSISVARSGFRIEDGTIAWNTDYNSPITQHFSMSEITNFSEYAPKATFTVKRQSKTKR